MCVHSSAGRIRGTRSSGNGRSRVGPSSPVVSNVIPCCMKIASRRRPAAARLLGAEALEAPRRGRRHGRGACRPARTPRRRSRPSGGSRAIRPPWCARSPSADPLTGTAGVAFALRSRRGSGGFARGSRRPDRVAPTARRSMADGITWDDLPTELEGPGTEIRRTDRGGLAVCLLRLRKGVDTRPFVEHAGRSVPVPALGLHGERDDPRSRRQGDQLRGRRDVLLGRRATTSKRCRTASTSRSRRRRVRRADGALPACDGGDGVRAAPRGPAPYRARPAPPRGAAPGG